jgi:rifampicin phosphotransferase
LAYTLKFTDVGSGDLTRVGGKGANLGEMMQAGLPIPPGFCVTTAAFTAFIRGATGVLDPLERLERPDDLDAIRSAGRQVRDALISRPIPKEVADSVSSAWQAEGEHHAYAVRSSATAEDLPDASFAGQQDTYLNVIGREAILDHVHRCWISLYTDRAIQYRIQHGFDHREVALAVVVQRMVLPDVSGILFTVDPIRGNRTVVCIDAGFGLGEALVSGLVSADLYRVDKVSRTIIDKTIADKRLMIRPLEGGGTEQIDLDDTQRHAQVLDDETLLRLTEVGLRVEAHYGHPQDIEWCIASGRCFVVQSRPVTTLFPIPTTTEDDDRLHAYFCFNHIQGMTDPIPDLGLELIRTVYPFGKEGQIRAQTPYLVAAGGRLYHDGTDPLQVGAIAKRFPKLLENSDPLMGRALAEVVTRARFQSAGLRQRWATSWAVGRGLIPTLVAAWQFMFFIDPEGEVSRRSNACDQEIDHWAEQLDATESGPELAHALRDMVSSVYPLSLATWIPMIFAALASIAVLRRLHPQSKADIDALLRATPNNVTTEKDLEITDLAESIRHLSGLTQTLRDHPEADPRTHLKGRPEAVEFLRNFDDWMGTYGARAPSEIDISRPRYREAPQTIVAAIVAALDQTPGEARARHRLLAGRALKAQERLIEHGGALKTRLTARLARVGRLLIAAREQPKFYGVRCLALARARLLKEADRLTAAGRLTRPEDIWFLTLDELTQDAFTTDLIEARSERFRRYKKLFPPRVMTSDGESVLVHHSDAGMPEGAIAGSSASAGVVEGPARIVRDPSTARLQKGDILVAPYTDPGWTPLFAQAAGLVMEVGGQMTHGSVVAREYGIPAVVCVPDATTLISDGQWIRVNGDLGYIEMVEAS